MILLDEEVESIEFLEKELRETRNYANRLNSLLASKKNSEHRKYAKKVFKFMEHNKYSFEDDKYSDFFYANDYGESKYYKWLYVNDFKQRDMCPSLIGEILKMDRTTTYYYLDGYKSEHNREAQKLKKEFEEWKNLKRIN